MRKNNDSLKAQCDNYVNPWQRISLVQRLRKIDLSKKKQNIIYIYDFPDDSTYRYRVFNIFESMQYSDDYSVTYFFRNELRALREYVKYASLLILSRVRWSYEIDEIILTAKKHSVSLAYDVDDMVFDITKAPLLMNTLNVHAVEDSYSHWFAYISRLQLAASKCDFYIGTNQFLANKLQGCFQKKAVIIPNYLNKDQLELSLKINELASNQIETQSDEIKLGYFSGSPSHNKDFEVISKDIADILARNRNITLLIVGFLDLPDYMGEFIKNKQLEFIPFQNFMNLQRYIASVDINLIPLQINEFTNCKSELKFFDAAIVKVASVASPTSVYVDAIKHGVNGLIAKQGEWSENIYRLINDKAKRKAMAEQAYTYCLEHYSGKLIENKIATAFSSLLSQNT